jgi:large subunit ribosomal protein L25
VKRAANSAASSCLAQRSPSVGATAGRLRRQGMVPGILYGGTDLDPVAFKVGARELRRLLVDGSALFDVKIGSETSVPAILKDRQDHPVRGEPLHVDFLEVRLDEKIHSVVAVELTGAEEAPGIVEGGVLEHVTRELQIEALPTDIPEQIAVDVSHLEINATLSLADV